MPNEGANLYIAIQRGSSGSTLASGWVYFVTMFGDGNAQLIMGNKVAV